MAAVSSDKTAIANEIYLRRHDIAQYTANNTLKVAYWDIRYGEQGRMTCVNDNLKNLDLFINAIRKESPPIANTHALWLRDVYVNLGLCTPFAIQAFTTMQTAASEYLSPPAARELAGLLDGVKKTLLFNDPLCQHLKAHQEALVEVVVNAMYSSSPYWSVRYGEAGRAACAVDTRYNIDYLIDAIGRNNLKGILIHTAWMRNFLVSRGMCSDYYIAAWTLLREAAISTVPAEYHDRLRDIHSAVVANLRYAHSFAQQVEAGRDVMIAAVMARHYDRSPALRSKMTRHDYSVEVSYKLSYIVDAVCSDQSEILLNHLHWMRGALAQLGYTPDDYDMLLAALMEVLPPHAGVQGWLAAARG